MRISGSGTASAGAGSGNEGNKATKNGGMIWDQIPGTGPRGTRTRFQWITHEASVEHAPGFSGVGGGGVLEPWASSDFLRKIQGNSRARRKILGSSAENSGNFASSDGIIRGFTNHDPRTVSCDSAACED